MNIADELNDVISGWSFKNFKFVDHQNDLQSCSKIYNFGDVKVRVYSDGDLEIDSPLYQSIRERYDYRSAQEAEGWLAGQLKYVDENYERLKIKPELWPRPLLNRLFDWISGMWKNSNHAKK